MADTGKKEDWPKWANEEVELSDANPRWAHEGERLAERLGEKLRGIGVTDVEHIGSTAIPGLPAKPIIDLMALVADYGQLRAVAEALAPDGWHYVPPELDLRPYRRFFVLAPGDRRVAHLHLFRQGEPRYKEQLAFRDALQSRRDWAMAYGELKVEWAERYRHDREGYTEAKSRFVDRILRELKVKVTTEVNTDLRYPVGRFHQAGPVTAQQKEQWLSEIEELPEKLKAALDGLSDAQLNEPYRPGGWTVKQVAHHLADSHMNSFIRFKLALTEENPAIKPYEEQLWAELPDTLDTPVFVSVALLTALHERWTVLLRSMSEGQYARTFFHPASKQISRLDVALGMYAWHGRHHVAHVTSLRERMGWQ